MPSFLRTILLACAVAVLTAIAGWWAAALIGLLWGIQGQRAAEAFVAGLLGWGGLLAWQAFQAPVWALAGRLAGIFPLPAWGLLAAGPLFAGLLAWSTAQLGSRLPVTLRAEKP